LQADPERKRQSMQSFSAFSHPSLNLSFFLHLQKKKKIWLLLDQWPKGGSKGFGVKREKRRSVQEGLGVHWSVCFIKGGRLPRVSLSEITVLGSFRERLGAENEV
jgi:hypothetical protein